MMMIHRKRWMIAMALALLLSGGVVALLPTIGATLLLHPPKRQIYVDMPDFCEEVVYQGEGVELRGWRCNAEGVRRGTLIYLHGHADNRSSGVGIAKRFRKRGFDVILYDSRSHGESGGSMMTYGYYEKHDLRRVIDTAKPGPVVLFGSSMGAAVALQLAADDKRVSGVVAAEAFSDLRTVVTERAPFFFGGWAVEKAIEKAEHKGHFDVDAVSPALAAREVSASVYLIHGELDKATPPDHSERIYQELRGAKYLVLVPDMGHNESLHGDVWGDIEQWVDEVVPIIEEDHS